MGYVRGGGESGTENDSSGERLNGDTERIPVMGPTRVHEGPKTAGGPISEAASADSGSDVLRQEQDGGRDVDAALERVWCIGHMSPSP